MCDAITLLNGAAVDSPATLKALIPDGDMTRVGSHHNLGDETCLCFTDIGAYLAMSSRRFKEDLCVLASIFSAWSEVDDEGRTYDDAFERISVSSAGLSDSYEIVKRPDWPHGFDGKDPDRLGDAGNDAAKSDIA